MVEETDHNLILPEYALTRQKTRAGNGFERFRKRMRRETFFLEKDEVIPVAATAANVHDSQLLGDIWHGDETRVWGSSAYAG